MKQTTINIQKRNKEIAELKEIQIQLNQALGANISRQKELNALNWQDAKEIYLGDKVTFISGRKVIQGVAHRFDCSGPIVNRLVILPFKLDGTIGKLERIVWQYEEDTLQKLITT